jgi:thiol-disulfide isomerase/thioredoxin
LSFVAALLGCQRPSAGPPAAKTDSSQIQLVRADAKSLEELIASHKGKVVFVDYWATWCGPCVEQFPHTVELAGKYRERGLATIAISFDLLADEPNVVRFLADKGASFDTLISKYDGVNQRAAVDFDVEALPQYRLYDRQGKLRQKWEGKPEEIEQKIEALLAEPHASDR